MSALSKAQQRMLASVADGEVTRHFDVYGGYWWTERGKRLAAYGKSEHFPPLPIRCLLARSLIILGPNERKFSGYHEADYALTPAGRSILGQSQP